MKSDIPIIICLFTQDEAIPALLRKCWKAEGLLHVPEIKSISDVHEIDKFVHSPETNRLWLIDLQDSSKVKNHRGLNRLNECVSQGIEKIGPTFFLLENSSDSRLLEAWNTRFPLFRGVIFRSMLDTPGEFKIGHRCLDTVQEFYESRAQRVANAQNAQGKRKIPEVMKASDEQLRFITLSWGKMGEFMVKLRQLVQVMKNRYVEKVEYGKNAQETLQALLNPSDKSPVHLDPWKSVFLFEDVTASPKEKERRIQIPVIPRDYVPCHLLLTGKTGTGKTLLTKLMRSMLDLPETAPIQLVNAAGISETMLEFELFGHTRGVATDMTIGREGHVLSSIGGILFFDEIGDIPLKLQPRLLTFLDSMQMTPRGLQRETPKLPLYVVAATNHDLAREVREGTFRSDLYHRFLLQIEIPSIQERREDIPDLALFALRNPTINITLRPESKGFRHPKVEYVTLNFLHALKRLPLEGNFRELQTILSQAVLKAFADFSNTLDVCYLNQEALQTEPRNRESRVFPPSNDCREFLEELVEKAWPEISMVIPDTGSSGPKKPETKRIFLGILWKIWNKAGWNQLPADYASYSTCRRRFRTWNQTGNWKKIRIIFLNNLSKADRNSWEEILR